MDVRMPDGTIISNVPDGTTQQEVLKRYNASKTVAPEEKQTLHTEETIYDPVSGLPLSSPAYGPEATGATKVVQKALTTAAGVPVQYATSTAKPIAGMAQLVGKIFGSNKAEEPVNAINQIQEGINQNAYSPITKTASFLGEAVNPLTVGMANQAMGFANKIPALPSYAKNVIGGALTGAGMGLTTPEKTGLTGQEFATEKALGTGTSALTGGAIPAVVEPAVKLTGSLLRKGLGISTGAGEKAFEEAYKAGKTGNKAFVENLKGNVPIHDVLDIANKDLNKIGQDLSAKYRSGMVDISNDKAVLSFDNINQAISDAKNIVSYKGQVINKSAAQKVAEAQREISKWENLNPSEFHTPEGMDKLKQKIGSILEDIPYEQKAARKAIQDIYGSIKSEIANQAPTYNKVMKDYHEGMDLVNDIKKTLSLGEGKNAETGIKKLQSIMRNNANTSWGNRLEVAKQLESQGGGELMPSLAGQALNAWTPRGIVGQGADIGAALMALSNPAALMAVPLTSPRTMGSLVYGAGKLGNVTPESQQLAKLLTIQAMNKLNQGE